jgi:hypothetical protein
LEEGGQGGAQYETLPKGPALWLCSSITIKSSLMTHLPYLTHSAGSKKEKWVSDHPGQVLLTAGQILWTAECERALADAELGPRKALKQLRKKWVGYLTKLTTLTRGKLEHVERSKVRAAAQQGACGWEGWTMPLGAALSCAASRAWPSHGPAGATHADGGTPHGRRPVNTNHALALFTPACQVVALITLEVHARDVIDRLVKAGASSPGDFEWASQLRFYWDKDANDVAVKQVGWGSYPGLRSQVRAASSQASAKPGKSFFAWVQAPTGAMVHC